MRIYEASLRYRLVESGPVDALSTAESVFRYMQSAFDGDPTVEWFFAILLNRKHRPLGRIAITKGISNSAIVHPREVFRPAVIANASALVVSHNHPSGDPAPSEADRQVTFQLREAARMMDIPLIDHVIVGYPEGDPKGRGYFSFREAGQL